MDTNKARKCCSGSACHTHTVDEAGKYPVIGMSDHAFPLWRLKEERLNAAQTKKDNESGRMITQSIMGRAGVLCLLDSQLTMPKIPYRIVKTVCDTGLTVGSCPLECE